MGASHLILAAAPLHAQHHLAHWTHLLMEIEIMTASAADELGAFAHPSPPSPVPPPAGLISPKGESVLFPTPQSTVWGPWDKLLAPIPPPAPTPLRQPYGKRPAAQSAAGSKRIHVATKAAVSAKDFV